VSASVQFAVIQFALALFGLTAMTMAMGRSARGRKWAPLIGLAGQPFWMVFAWQVDAWGLMALATAYSIVYARGAWLQWKGGAE
jgi:hypothetical protein